MGAASEWSYAYSDSGYPYSASAKSPNRGARDTALDAAANCSAGANSTPDVDGGINSATYLGKQPCRDHEDGGKDETTDREVAKHIYLPRYKLP